MNSNLYKSIGSRSGVSRNE